MPFNPTPIKNFIGNGLVFPIQLDGGSGVLSTGLDLVRASIKNILAFTIGDRYLLGEFGSLLDNLIEEPNDDVLGAALNQYVSDAILRWEPRVVNISTTITRVNDTMVELSLQYYIKNAQTPDNFVYPFYQQIIY
jgi:phage baseplate assembly protein W